jgi:hypothetical protein
MECVSESLDRLSLAAIAEFHGSNKPQNTGPPVLH